MSTTNVALTKACNGRCPFCIDRHACANSDNLPVAKILANVNTDTVLLLGGEPLLYPYLYTLISKLKAKQKTVIMTTNASLLREKMASLTELDALNISIHHPDLEVHNKLTGLTLNKSDLRSSIAYLKQHGVDVRINCNLMRGYVDSEYMKERMISFASLLGANGVRFSELMLTDGLDEDTRKWIIEHRISASSVDCSEKLAKPEIYGCEQKLDSFVSFKVVCKDVFAGSTDCRPSPPRCNRKSCGSRCGNCKFYTYSNIVFNDGRKGSQWSDYIRK